MSSTDRQTGGALANIKEILRRMKVHNVTVSAAGIAFYGLLALVPTMIALVSVYAIAADPSDIERQVRENTASLDDDTRGFITNQLESVVGDVEESEDGGADRNLVGRYAGFLFGLGLALFSASGAVQKLMSTVGVAYEVEDGRKGWQVRGLAYLFTLGAIVGVVLIIFAIGVIPALADRANLGGLASALISIATIPVLGLLFAGGLTILYRYGPDRRPRTPWWNPGAVVGTILFLLFAIGFSIYSSNVGAMPASYGLLGTVAAVMIFLQLTAIAVIIGAEVNGAIESRATATAPATAASTTGALRGSAVAAARPAGNGTTGEGRGGYGGSDNSDQAGIGDTEPEPLGFGKALAGLLALAALGRGSRPGK